MKGIEVGVHVEAARTMYSTGNDHDAAADAEQPRQEAEIGNR